MYIKMKIIYMTCFKCRNIIPYIQKFIGYRVGGIIYYKCLFIMKFNLVARIGFFFKKRFKYIFLNYAMVEII